MSIYTVKINVFTSTSLAPQSHNFNFPIIQREGRARIISLLRDQYHRLVAMIWKRVIKIFFAKASKTKKWREILSLFWRFRLLSVSFTGRCHYFIVCAMSTPVTQMPQLQMNERKTKKTGKAKKSIKESQKENMTSNVLPVERKKKTKTKKKRKRKCSTKRIELTPKNQTAQANSADPSPMTMVFQRQTISAPKRNIVSLSGPFSRPTEEVAQTLRSLKYEICSPVSKETALVICADSNNSAKAKLAKAYGIPLIKEEELFNKPEGESDTESDEELVLDFSEDDSQLLTIDDPDDDSMLDIHTEIKSGERMKDTKVAFMGKFETPFLELKQTVLKEGGQITAVEALVCPPSHIVLSEEYGTPEEFIKEYSSYWWIRSAVFLDEDQLLNICDGTTECPRKKPKVNRSVQQSMKRLSLEVTPSVSIVQFSFSVNL